MRRLRTNPVDGTAVADSRAAGFELLRAGRFEDASHVFEAVRQVAPDDQPSLYGGALALFNLRRVDEAEVLARAAAEKASLGASTEKNPGTSAVASGADAQGARRIASDAFVLLGVILAVKKDDTGALRAVRQAVALAPTSFDAQFALGRALFGVGDPAGAAHAFRAAVELKPGDAKSRFFLATALEAAGEDEKALAAYRDLAASHPQSAEGYLGAGVLLLKRGGGNIFSAVAELEKAVSLDGNLYEGRIALGRALIRTDRVAEAIEHLKRAAELVPSNPEPHYQLSIAYRRLGRKDEAKAESAVVRKLHESRRRVEPRPLAERLIDKPQ